MQKNILTYVFHACMESRFSALDFFVEKKLFKVKILKKLINQFIGGANKLSIWLKGVTFRHIDLKTDSKW